MAPNCYIQARKDSLNEDDVMEIDGRPYWPFLAVDTKSEVSVKEVAAKVLLSAANFANVDWSQHLQVNLIPAGNTNVLFCVSGWNQLPLEKEDDKEIIGNSVLLRVFGAEGIIDRDVENATYAALWRQSLVPNYYGRFANGRIEQFLEGMRPLQDRELADPEISQKIAQQMAHLHSSFPVPQDLQSYHSEPRLWKELGEWMTQALAIQSYKTPLDLERAKELVDTAKLPAEIEWLQNHVVPKDTPICFCHNDVLASNIMYSNQTKGIQLIDFEYGGVNFAAFDIANHFNEFAGGTDHGTPNYEWFPSLEFQRQFITAYLQATQGYKQQRKVAVSDEKEIDTLHAQVQAFVLVDHLYWGLWGVNQAANEGTQGFDYLLYGSHRINEYYRQKDKMRDQK